MNIMNKLNHKLEESLEQFIKLKIIELVQIKLTLCFNQVYLLGTLYDQPLGGV